ncbi:MAG: hypothetical protein LBC71_05050, partial [Oscillospiraceae bacterium]|nr:hypothetical protein [Oscillospiraceae bacterium]
MKIDASQVLAQGGVKIKSGTSSTTDSLKEGDILRASVVSKDKSGVVNLRTESGFEFTAKLGIDLNLSPGDVIRLQVSGKDDEQVSLAFSGVEKAEDELTVAEKNLVRDFDDKSLAPYAGKLSEMNIPVTESSARMMREILA